MAKNSTAADTYVWEGMNKQGKRTKGEVSGSTLALAKADLRRQGITPLKVKKKPKPLFGKSKKKITSSDIAIFSRQLATMMAAGVPMVQSFEIVGKGHENPSMQDLIMAVKADVESGSSLSTRSISMTSTAAWYTPVNRPVSSKPCWTRSPPTRKRWRPSRARSRRPCSTQPPSWPWLSSLPPSC